MIDGLWLVDPWEELFNIHDFIIWQQYVDTPRFKFQSAATGLCTMS